MAKITFFHHRVFGKSETIQIPKVQPIPYTVELEYCLQAIRNGEWIEAVQKCRLSYINDDQVGYDTVKSQLPVILPCGIFTGQDLASMSSSTNLMLLDFDHFPKSKAEVQRLREIIQSDPYTYVAFLSVSGFGLKVLIKLENDVDNNSHHEYFRAIKDYYLHNYPEFIEKQYWDDSSSNINRMCYISHDPDLYSNPQSYIWNERPIVQQELDVIQVAPNEPQHIGNGCEDIEVDKIIRYLEGGWNKFFPMIDGHRHNSTFFRAKELAEWGVNKNIALHYFEQFLPEANDPEDIIRQINNAYEKADFNSKRRNL